MPGYYPPAAVLEALANGDQSVTVDLRGLAVDALITRRELAAERATCRERAERGQLHRDQLVDQLNAARARIAELEAQREPIGYLIVTEVEGRRVVHGDHRQLMTCAEAIESVGRSDLPRGMRHLLCTVQEADR